MKSKIKYKKRILIKYWFLRHRILTGLLLGLLAIGTYGAVGHIRYEHKVAIERAQFAQAKTDLDNIYNQIIAITGQPLAHSSQQYCSRTSTEAFASKGAMSCTLTIDANFGDKYWQDIKSVSESIINNDYIGEIPISSFNREGSYEEKSSTLFTNKTLRCGITILFGKGNNYPFNYGASISSDASQNLTHLWCFKGTLTNYYPLKQM